LHEAPTALAAQLDLWIAWRHLRAKRSERFISLITWLSVGGVTLGVAALVVVFSVMTGYKDLLRDKLVGVNAHAVVHRIGAEIDQAQGLATYLGKMDEVADATPFVMGQAMLAARGVSEGAVLRGVDPANAYWLASFAPAMVEGAIDGLSGREPGVLLGKELAATLKVKTGDTLRATIPVGSIPRIGVFRVKGIFSSGMFDFDSTVAFTTIASAQKLFGLGTRVNGIELRFHELDRSTELALEVGRRLGHDYWVADWKRLNRNIFYALELQRIVLTLILGLIVLVAAFNVAATLIMTVLEKTRDIGILKAMGASNKLIRRIFALQGLLIGGVGAGAGLSLGLGICFVIDRYQIIKIPGDIYLFDRLPVEVNLLACLAFGALAVVLCWVATLYPCRKASRLDPVRAIRTE
jgi:lipoprotein-releasing system permease protein